MNNLVELFEMEAEKHPFKQAVVCKDKSLTYFELNKYANQLAKILRKNGVKRNDIVCLISVRSVEMIIAMIGILKSGAAFLPIDHSFPRLRKKYIVENSGSRFIVTYHDDIDVNISKISIENIRFHDKVDNLESINKLSDTAYCIYTSGSTGTPKGVLISHKNVLNLSSNNQKGGYLEEAKSLGITKIISYASISFDMFIAESLVPLLHSMTIFIASEDEISNPDKFIEIQNKYHIEMIQLTPSRLKLWLDNIYLYEAISQLKLIILGGEVVESNLVKKLARITDATILNLYGPTETTVWVSKYKIDRNCILENIPIGKALPNNKIFIIDSNGNKVIEKYGEIYILGDSVGKGYINAEHNNNFIFSDDRNEIYYKTGDIGKITDTGLIYYLKRKDMEIKIRGYRVDINEIQKCLKAIEDIEEVQIVVQKDKFNNSILSAYYKSDFYIDNKQIIEKMKKILPPYMIPTIFYRVNNFPINRNGKLDIKKLADYDFKYTNYTSTVTTDVIEFKIKKIWENSLNISILSTSDSIYNYGAHSLIISKIVKKINDEFNLHIKISEVMINAITIKQQTELVKKMIDKGKYDYEE